MARISYKAGMNNTTLTDFSGFREMVIANQVNDVPGRLKTQSYDTNMRLDFY